MFTRVILSLALFSPLALAGSPATCPDLTGVFASEQDEAYGIEWIWRQQGCAQISQQGRSGQNYGEETIILTDGVRRRPCPTCPWTTMTFTEDSLWGFVEGETVDSCNERHRYWLNETRDVVDDVTLECPNGQNGQYRTLYRRHG